MTTFAQATTLLAGTAFPLGTGEIDAQSANQFDVARTREGSIAAWTMAGARKINITRLDRNGAWVETTEVVSHGSSMQIASTGSEGLLVEAASWSEELFARTIDNGAVSEVRRLPIRASEVVQLEWTGHAYALVVRHADFTISTALLDRDGIPITGIIRFPRVTYSKALLACGDDRCLMAFAYPGAWAGRVAVIDEGDFPPPSQQSRGFVQTLPLPGSVLAVGFDEALGFYSLTGQELRVHGRLRGLSGGLFTPHRTVVLTESISAYSDVVTVSRAGAVYVAYTGTDWWHRPTAMVLLRVTHGGRVEKVHVALEPMRRTPVQFIVHGSAALIWRNDGTSSYHASRVEENALEDLGVPVTAGLAREIMPRIVRGTTTSLVTWVEAFAARQTLYAAILDADGRQVNTPTVLAVSDIPAGLNRLPFRDVVIAFDGVNFLALWRATYRAMYPTYLVFGQMISQDGQLVGERIDLSSFSMNTLTLVWTGSEYWTTGYGGVVRISPSGQLLTLLLSLSGEDNMLLVRDEDGRLRGLRMNYESAIVAAGPQIWSTYGWVEIEEGTNGPYPQRSSGGHGSGQYAPSVEPTVAFGGGHRLAVFDSSGWSPGPLRDLDSGAALPYPVPRWPGHAIRLDAHWTGHEFVVLAGKTLARHSPLGEIRTISLGDDVVDSAGVVDGPDAVLVVKERDGTVEAERVTLPFP
ncbi:MAG TPA: hypothetical protein VEK79_12410 [Thermoanaerobaculia bacterium]|nr:hypothetical protein [Thermoanaerobaculia bacterium]